MTQRSILEQLRDQLSRLVPRGAAAADEIRNAVHQGMEKSLAQMDLVTREEFEQHRQALERAEARVAELEAIVARLEETQQQEAQQRDQESQ